MAGLRRADAPQPGPIGVHGRTFYVHIEPNGDVHPCAQHGADFPPKNIVARRARRRAAHAQHHDCGDCFSAYLNERKALFGLRPAALLEMCARRG